MFILVIVGALVLTVLGAVFLGDDGSDPKGKVWSPEHGHWH